MDAASVARELMEAFNRNDWDRMQGLCSPDVVYIEKGTNRTAKGVEGLMQVAQAWRAAFSDGASRSMRAATTACTESGISMSAGNSLTDPAPSPGARGTSVPE